MASDWEPYMQIPVSEYRELQTALAAAERWLEQTKRERDAFIQLAAANASIETWREALAKCEADRSATKDELAAANAAGEDYRLEREAYRKSYEEAKARAEAAEQSRDLTERVLVDTTEKLLAAERERDVARASIRPAESIAQACRQLTRKAEADRDEAVGLLRRVWPEIVMGNNETVDNWQEEATTFLAATEES